MQPESFHTVLDLEGHSGPCWPVLSINSRTPFLGAEKVDVPFQPPTALLLKITCAQLRGNPETLLEDRIILLADHRSHVGVQEGYTKILG